MSLVSRIIGRLCKLPAPITRDIVAEPLRIPMRDGTELLADRYYSREATQAPHRIDPKLLWTQRVQIHRDRLR